MESIGRFVGAKVRQGATPGAMLDAYIENVLAFIDTHRIPMRALTEILLSGAMKLAPGDAAASTSHLEEILRAGQASGEFRDFDSRVMAATIQRAVDGVPFLLDSAPDLDCAAYARELITLFRLGTRRNPGGTE